MATVIERGVIGSKNVRRVAELTGANEYEAFGRIAALWESSQEAERAAASDSEVLFWLGTSDPKWIDALCDSLAGYLKRSKKGDLKIVGNSKHIRKKRQIKERAKSGGEAFARKQKERKAKEKQTQDAQAKSLASSQPQEGTIPCHAIPGHADNITPDEVRVCIEEWGRTLKHYRKDKDPRFDEDAIYRLIKKLRNAERAQAVLAGFRAEKKSDKYDPADYLNVSGLLGERVEHRARRERLEINGSALIKKRDTPIDPPKYEKSWDEVMADLEGQP